MSLQCIAVVIYTYKRYFKTYKTYVMLSADLQDLFQLSLSCIDILLRIAAPLHYPLRIP